MAKLSLPQLYYVLSVNDAVYLDNADNQIATSRSIKLSIILGEQDLTQLRKDYRMGQPDFTMNISGYIITSLCCG